MSELYPPHLKKRFKLSCANCPDEMVFDSRIDQLPTHCHYCGTAFDWYIVVGLESD